MPITINGTGTITGISAGGLPSATVTQATLATPVAGTGPAFSAYLGTNQTVTSGAITKLQLNTEVFDTNNNFDSTTNYRFTPTVAGYYQFNYELYGSSGTSMSNITPAIYKNGAVYQYGVVLNGVYGNAAQAACGSTLIYLNGSTDYVEFYGLITGTGACVFTAASGTVNYLTGSLVRSA